MRKLAIFFVLTTSAMAQSGRIPLSKQIEETVYTEVVRIPVHPQTRKATLGSVRFHYPKGYLIRPKCYDVRDKQPSAGPWITQANEEGFTITGPLGHEISVTCRAIKANGPLA